MDIVTVSVNVKCPICDEPLELPQEDSCFIPAGICPNCKAIVSCILTKNFEYEISAIPNEHRDETTIDSSLIPRYCLPSPLFVMSLEPSTSP